MNAHLITRKAKMSDIEDVHRLITYYADKGLMLPRARALLYEAVREITIVEDSGSLVGAGSLHIVWEDLAEIRALAVYPDKQKAGIGRRLVESFLEEARDLKIKKVFTLTYQPGFFIKCGFKVVSKKSLSQKVWKECINCPKFPNCDEESLLIEL